MIVLPGSASITAGLALALVVSLGANVLLAREYVGAREDVATVKADYRSVASAANQCSDNTKALKAAADAREQAASASIAVALGVARQNGLTASKLLASPPAVPGNDCASARAAADAWLAGRAAK